jgi:hypothetical protein
MFYFQKRQSRQENIRSQDNRRYRMKALLTSPKTEWTFIANRRAGFEGGRMAKLHRVCPTFLEAGFPQAVAETQSRMSLSYNKYV